MFGKIYETTWWGFPTKTAWGNIYYDLASSIISAFTGRIEADGGTVDNEIGLDSIDESASLTMLPNAYKDGTLYSVLPEDGTGDFDVVRGSGATRVNADGLIEDMRYTTGNLVDYSTITPSSSALTLNADGKWVFDDSGNAYLTAPNIVANVGDVFNVLIDVSVPGGGDANFRFTKGNAQTVLFNYTDFSDGVTEFQATVTGNDGYLDRIFYPASLNDGESTLNRFEVTKIVDDTNLPRIDHTSGSPVLLVEPQSTNLCFDSNTFAALSGAVVTQNAAISPDGTLNAAKVNFSTGLNDGVRLNIGGVSASPSTEYTLSFYAKNFAGDGLFNLRMDTDTDTLVSNADFTATSEWARYTHTFTTDAAASSFKTTSRFRNRTDNNEVLFYGVQLEEENYATSYIPTNGTIATRLADVVSVDLTSFSISSITETIDGVEQTPITSIPSTYTIPQGNINKIVMT